MTTFVLRDGKLVEKRYAPPIGGVFVLRDKMDPTVHPITGKMMDSKSEFRRVTRANGCVEVGNEPMRAEQTQVHDRSELQRDIYNAMRQSEHRRADRAENYGFGQHIREGWN